jgi:hypothetical protein
VFGGGIANAYPLFRNSMEEYIRSKYPFSANLDKLQIDVHTGNDIPVIGASLI